MPGLTQYSGIVLPSSIPANFGERFGLLCELTKAVPFGIEGLGTTATSPTPLAPLFALDGSSTPVIPRESSPVVVQESVAILFNSTFFAEEGKTTTASRVFINFTFGLYNTTNMTYDAGYCINSTYGNNLFRYDYGSPWVNEPRLDPAIVEVAVW